MQTIPDSVLDRIIDHRPHLAAVVANLRNDPERAVQYERPLASAYLSGETRLSALETWHLASCAAGKPYGADAVWIDVTTAAHESGYDPAHVRRLIYNHQIDGEQRKGVWWVRRADIAARVRDPRGRPKLTATD